MALLDGGQFLAIGGDSIIKIYEPLLGGEEIACYDGFAPLSCLAGSATSPRAYCGFQNGWIVSILIDRDSKVSCRNIYGE